MTASLAGIRVVSTALNLPGPAACRRLRALGASIEKVEPPGGDPMQSYCAAFYEWLHEGIAVQRLDLKTGSGRSAIQALLEPADLLVTAQRTAALERLGLDARSLRERHPRLAIVSIIGHAPPDEDRAGHDLTYVAEAGLLSPPALPVTLYADMAAAERAVSEALALLVARERGSPAGHAFVSLAEAARALALPLAFGLTGAGTLLGGALPGYNLFATRRGWIAVAALEPHFAQRLAAALGLEKAGTADLANAFAEATADEWSSWARARDIPLVALSEYATLQGT